MTLARVVAWRDLDYLRCDFFVAVEINYVSIIGMLVLIARGEFKLHAHRHVSFDA